jgi:hypothetical protein
MAVDPSCKITNNAGKAVVVLNAYISAGNTARNSPQSSPQQGYQQTLKLLIPAEGGHTLADGATGTFRLKDTRTDSAGKSQPNYVYQLLICDPATLAPVMNVGETLSFATSPWSYPPITVTVAAARKTGLALAFCQHIMACPTSMLATGFVTALNAAQQQSTFTAMQTMANFFSSTEGYQGVDFPSYVAASTYLTSFASAFGLGDDGTPGRTYWLYASADVIGTVDAIGTVVFTRNADAPNPADPADRNSGFTIACTPSAGSGTRNLTLSGGQYVDDVTSDAPDVCLQGSYTSNDADTTRWPILLGTVDGTKVTGISLDPSKQPGEEQFLEPAAVKP